MRHLSPASYAVSPFKNLTAKLRTTCAVVALTVLAATNASAVPVTYTVHADATGSLHNYSVLSFMGPITITATGDTADIAQDWLHPTQFNSGMLSVTFELGGLSPFSGNPGLYMLASNGTQLAFDSADEFGNVAGIRLEATSGEGYALESAVSGGPMAYDMSVWSGKFQTERGMLDFTSFSNITFEARVDTASAVPEPGSLPLFASAGAALLLAAKRRRQAGKVS